jgi:hypothetical protein
MKGEKMKTTKSYRPLNDEEVVTLMLAMDPDLDHIEIKEQFSDSPFVLLTKEGASFEGVVTGIRDEAVQLRQADGKLLLVKKSAIAAVRRP